MRIKPRSDLWFWIIMAIGFFFAIGATGYSALTATAEKAGWEWTIRAWAITAGILVVLTSATLAALIRRDRNKDKPSHSKV